MTSNVGLRGFLLVFVTAFALLHHATSDDIDVLDKEGWTVPTTGNDQVYRTWAAGRKFEVGDTLVFNFPTNAHDVAKVSMEDYDSCTASNQNNILKQGPARIPLNSTGPHYFICTISTHCKEGQRLAINVTDDSETETPSNSPTTTTTLPIAPTPRNSASHTATASFALAMLFISTILLH
ncbi:hypothetical protein C5167_023787 [Papaver somniferum]|uniref:Phytocyanin domain-containing protein n=1 Tax=Papaver somniferum TaxID=3469 RepID=A0A4Y7JLS4_PAPSO|nr:umecyanin-like [Papaver somniferum]RZC62033.1 hypothetical protein C5167_023787 [Papaver somniferum]